MFHPLPTPLPRAPPSQLTALVLPTGVAATLTKNVSSVSLSFSSFLFETLPWRLECVATYGSAPVSYKPTATNTANYGTGATHTVIVAPTQGVLRYIPFAVNATVGDTIKFMWGANNHTVTKSSALLPCNRSGDALFASGTQNKDFVCE